MKSLPVLLALAVVGVASCTASGTPELAQSGDLIKISVRSALTPSAGLTGPFLYGVEEGFYEREGLDVSVSDGKGSLSVAKDVAQGNVEVGQVGSPIVAQAVNQGMPLISVAQEFGRSSYGLIVEDQSSIHGFEDLSGKTVVVSAGSPETVLLPAALDKAGVEVSDVRMLNVDATVKGSTYASGQADALGTDTSFFYAAVNPKRPSRVLNFDDAGITMPNYSLVVRPDLLEAHPDVVRRFVKATLAADEAARNDPDGVIDALHKNRPEVTNLEQQKAQFEMYADYRCDDQQAGLLYGEHAPEAWDAGLRTLSRYGALAGEPQALDHYYTNQFFEGEDKVTDQRCGESQ